MEQKESNPTRDYKQSSHKPKSDLCLDKERPRSASRNSQPKWDDRHHVGSKVQPRKKLPPPPAKFTALHKGPIKPVVDTGRNPKTATRIHRPLSAKKSSSKEKTRSLRPAQSTNEMSYERNLVTVQNLAQLFQYKKLRTKQDINLPNVALEAQEKPRRRINLTLDLKNDEDKEVKNSLELDLSDVNDRELNNRSFVMSNSGTITIENFEIQKEGITRTPERSSLVPKNIKQNLVVLSTLGKGASGVVFKGFHLPSLRIIAVKSIPVFENNKRHQMIAELKALYSNLVPINDDLVCQSAPCDDIVYFYDAFINPDEGNISIAMEYMDGGSLQDIVDTGGCSSENALANISYHVLKGLAFIHKKHQLHRDIKPSNLLINHLGEVKISDFGIVREMENSVAAANTFVGTLTYMSPERISGEDYSYSSDIWSVGLSLMTCALGYYPYTTKSGYWELLHSIKNQDIPTIPVKLGFSEEFHDFLNKCLIKDKHERWSAQQLLKHPFLKKFGTPSTKSYSENDDSLFENMKMQLMDIISLTLEHYTKTIKNLIESESFSFDQVLAWARLLPTMQKSKLNYLAYQLGLPRFVVYEEFQQAMNNLLSGVKDDFFPVK